MRLRPGTIVLAITAFLLSITASLGAAAAAGKPIASVPYVTDYYGWLTIKVRVNGEGPYDFIIDTGATNSLVFQNLADIHAFPPSGNPPQTVFGLASQGAFPTFDIGDLQVGEAPIGGARLSELTSVVLPDWTVEKKPQGILGLDFLTRYIFVFNAAPNQNAGRLDIYDPQDGPNMRDMRGWKTIRLEQRNFGIDVDHDLYTAQGLLNSRFKVRFMVDLGASGTVVNWATITNEEGFRINLAATANRLRNRITGALDQDPTVARAVRVSRLKVGRQVWRRRVLTLHDAPIFEELGMKNTPFGLFGADLVRDRSFMLNLPGEEIRIGQAPRS